MAKKHKSKKSASKGSESSSKSSSKSPKKKDNTILYGIGVLVLIVVIILLVRSGEEPAEPADVDQTTDSGDQVDTGEETGMEDTDEGTEEVTDKFKCDESATIGFKKCDQLANGDAEVTILHQGMGTLTGAELYLYDENEEIIEETSMIGVVEGGTEETYTLPLSDYPQTYKVEIKPIMETGGKDKICVNQQVVVIPSTSCR
ncbi:MAG: hypothetical protein R6U32_02365 [Candidatus Woesearchaeota archaeon]